MSYIRCGRCGQLLGDESELAVHDAEECPKNQGDLFEPYPAKLYNGSPPSEATPTSMAAAESVRIPSGTMRGRVLALFHDRDWTDDELEEQTGWRHQTVSARRRELVLLGKLTDSGRTRTTRSGRKATIWTKA